MNINVAALIAVGIILLIGFPVHEFTHALVADRLGDHTARYMGRLSLDPRVHFDPLGGGILVLSALVGGIFVGWAKPTPVNPVNLQGGRQGEAWVAAGGPLSNLVMAALVAVAIRAIITLALPVPVMLFDILSYFVLINIFLFIFNLIPIPPLDGYHVLTGLVDPRTAYQLRQLEQYGFILILLIFLFAGPILGPIGTAIYRFLVGV